MLTYVTALSHAKEAGDNHAKQNQRAAWNEDDFNFAAAKVDTLLQIMRDNAQTEKAKRIKRDASFDMLKY